MFIESLNSIIYYLDLYFMKGFIQTISALSFSLLSFIEKSSKEIRLCIDYWRLNTIIRNDCYSISHIEKTLA